MTRFAKAHACGNDFLIVEGACDPGLAKKLCERHTGIGADGVEFFEPTGGLTGRIRLANADGSIAEISGNGTRCAAAWLAHKEKASAGDVITLETDAGPRVCTIVATKKNDFQIAAGMGVPEVSQTQVTLADKIVVYGVQVSMGNPHFVIVVHDENFRAHNRGWQELGREICFHKQFPQQINVIFVRMIQAHNVLWNRNLRQRNRRHRVLWRQIAHDCPRSRRVAARGLAWPRRRNDPHRTSTTHRHGGGTSCLIVP
jgi:diaminopimelate epimerase